MKRLLVPVVLCGVACLLAAAPEVAAPAAYSNDLEKTAVGKLPEEFYVVNGTFAVREEGGNHFIEAPGEPLDTLGLLFGPEGQALQDVSAKVWGTSAGRLFPEFAVGSNDVSGYKVWVMPGQQRIELRKGNDTAAGGEYEVKAQADYKGWQSGQWTAVRLRVTDAGGGKWKVEGKAWPSAGKEPEQWSVSFDETEAPAAGRASVWANPFPGTPVRFDDLKAAPAKGK